MEALCVGHDELRTNKRRRRGQKGNRKRYSLLAEDSLESGAFVSVKRDMRCRGKSGYNDGGNAEEIGSKVDGWRW